MSLFFKTELELRQFHSSVELAREWKEFFFDIQELNGVVKTFEFKNLTQRCRQVSIINGVITTFYKNLAESPYGYYDYNLYSFHSKYEEIIDFYTELRVYLTFHFIEGISLEDEVFLRVKHSNMVDVSWPHNDEVCKAIAAIYKALGDSKFDEMWCIWVTKHHG